MQDQRASIRSIWVIEEVEKKKKWKKRGEEINKQDWKKRYRDAKRDRNVIRDPDGERHYGIEAYAKIYMKRMNEGFESKK